MDNLWITGNQYLVGGSTPLKNMKVNWDDYSQLNGKIIQSCSSHHQPVIFGKPFQHRFRNAGVFTKKLRDPKVDPPREAKKAGTSDGFITSRKTQP